MRGCLVSSALVGLSSALVGLPSGIVGSLGSQLMLPHVLVGSQSTEGVFMEILFNSLGGHPLGQLGCQNSINVQGI